MKKVSVILAAIAAVVLFQGLTNASASTVDRILADASLGMAIPLFLVSLAFWASDEK